MRVCCGGGGARVCVPSGGKGSEEGSRGSPGFFVLHAHTPGPGRALRLLPLPGPPCCSHNVCAHPCRNLFYKERRHEGWGRGEEKICRPRGMCVPMAASLFLSAVASQSVASVAAAGRAEGRQAEGDARPGHRVPWTRGKSLGGAGAVAGAQRKAPRRHCIWLYSLLKLPSCVAGGR